MVPLSKIVAEGWKRIQAGVTVPEPCRWGVSACAVLSPAIVRLIRKGFALLWSSVPAPKRRGMEGEACGEAALVPAAVPSRGRWRPRRRSERQVAVCSRRLATRSGRGLSRQAPHALSCRQRAERRQRIRLSLPFPARIRGLRNAGGGSGRAPHPSAAFQRWRQAEAPPPCRRRGDCMAAVTPVRSVRLGAAAPCAGHEPMAPQGAAVSR